MTPLSFTDVIKRGQSREPWERLLLKREGKKERREGLDHRPEVFDLIT